MIRRVLVLSGVCLSTQAMAVEDSCDGFGYPIGEFDYSQSDAVYGVSTTSRYAGRSMSANGDINGDGLADLIIGVPGGVTNGAQSGEIAIYFGPLTDGTFDLSMPDATINGASQFELAGWSVDIVPDLNADGTDDIVIGTYALNGALSPQGSVYVVYGGASVTGVLDLPFDADASILGEATFDYFGRAVAGVGDINDDGFGDLLVGAPGQDTNGSESGAAYVFYGPVSGVMTAGVDADRVYRGAGPGSQAGWSVAPAWDFDGDDVDDFVIGSPTDSTFQSRAGALHVIAGDSSWTSGTQSVQTLSSSVAIVELTGDASERVGYSIAPLSDVDGDGFSDIVYGAPYAFNGNRGGAFLLQGSDTISGTMNHHIAWETAFKGETANDLFGAAVGRSGDIDNDGQLDLVVGAERADGDTVIALGAGYIFYGPFESGEIKGEEADVVVKGNTYLGQFGTAVTVSPDVTDDGYADVFLGSWRENYGAPRSGLVAGVFGGEDAEDLQSYYADVDLDTWGDENTSADHCPSTAPAGWVSRGGDCNDADPAYRPGAPELDCASGNDYNCDGQTGTADNDGDGFGACLGDCNDDPNDNGNLMHPGRSETCDALDNDCNGVIDDNATDAPTWSFDGDGDGYGIRGLEVKACETPPGLNTAMTGDCNDGDPNIFPNANEYCDGVDNDCDDFVDEADALDAAPWFADTDGDGYGDRDNQISGCFTPSGYTDDPNDCDDSESLVSPAAVEICDFQDNNCTSMDYLGGLIDLDMARYTVKAMETSGKLGSAVHVLADQDGDGIDELVVAAPNTEIASQSFAGAVYVINGRNAGGDIFPDQLRSDGAPLWDARIRDVRRNSFTGSEISHGDINGDGTPDLVIAAHGRRNPNNYQGGVFVFYGPVVGDLTLNDASVHFNGADKYYQLGSGLDVKDVDDDGFDDILMGSMTDESTGISDAGAAYLVFGSATLVGGTMPAAADAHYYGTVAQERLGGSVVFAGDLDNDGYQDLAFGSPVRGGGNPGAITVVYGSAARFTGDMAVNNSFAEVLTTATGSEMGRAIVAMGDFDDDGVDDLGVRGYITGFDVILGGTRLTNGADITEIDRIRFTTTDLGALFAFSATGGVDLNGDSIPDLVLGLPGDDSNAYNAGAVKIIYGGQDFASMMDGDSEIPADVESAGRLDPTSTFPTYSYRNLGVLHGADIEFEAAESSFGNAVAIGGDLTGDGEPDLVVGAPEDTQTFANGGSAYVFSAGPYGFDTPTTAGNGELFADLALGTLTDWTNGGGDTLGDTFDTYYWDFDADGYTAENGTRFASCEAHAPTSFSDPLNPVVRGAFDQLLSTDCNDFDATIFPGAQEFTGDGIDADCDGYDSPNTVPDIQVILSPFFPTALDELEAEIFVLDDDWGTAEQTDITVTVRWYIDEVLTETETVMADGDGTLAYAYFASGQAFKGQFVRVEVEADDTRGVSDVSDDEELILNTPPWVADDNGDPGGDCTAGPANPSTATTLTSNCGGILDADLTDSGNLEGIYQWEVKVGALWTSIVGADESSMVGGCSASGGCFRGDLVRVKLTPYDGEDFGAPAYSAPVVIGNEPPVVTSCTIAPPTAYTFDTITATAIGSDADIDAVNFSYEWRVNGSTVPGVTGDTLPTTEYVHFDNVQVICTPNDGYVNGADVGSNILTIENSLPVDLEASLSNASPTSADGITVILDNLGTDADGDPVTVFYQWRRDGTVFGANQLDGISSTSSSIQAADTTRNEVWTVRVIQFDGFDYGEFIDFTITIQNATPRADSIAISPDDPNTLDDIETVAAGWFDQDGDAEAYDYVWYINGSATAYTTETLSQANTVRGDSVYVVATPNDGEGGIGSSVTSNTLVVGNYIPDPPVIATSPIPPSNTDDLDCTIVVDSFDADGDTFSYEYRWVRTDPSALSVNGQVLSNTLTLYADRWRCEARALDSYGDYSEWAESPEVAIQDQNAPPAPEITVLSGPVNDSTVTISGTCVSGANDCDTLRITADDGTIRNFTTSCTADAFSEDITVTNGLITDFYSVCIDTAANESLESNIIEIEFCDPEDLYEGGSASTVGDALADAYTEATWELLDDNSSVLEVTGNIVREDTFDWFEFVGSDNVTADESAGLDYYDFQVELYEGEMDYNLQVYSGTGGSVSLRTAGLSDVSTFQDYFDGTADLPDWTAGSQQCTDDTQVHVGSMIGPVGTAKQCEDMGKTYVVRVAKDGEETCNHYTLRVTNGG